MSQAGIFVPSSGPGSSVQTLTGNTGGAVPPTLGNINVIGAGFISVAGNPGTSTLTISDSGGVATLYTEDVGTATPALNNLNIFGAHGINTAGSGSTVTIAVNNTLTLGDLSPVVGNSLTLTSGNEIITAGNLIITAGRVLLPNPTSTHGQIEINTFPVLHGFGHNGTADGNAWVGNSGNFTLTGTQNNAFGFFALSSLTTGGTNQAFGHSSLASCTTGSENCGYGESTLASLISGTGNIAIGFDAGSSYTTSESFNIIIGTGINGTVGESRITRIGSGQSKCFIAGIDGVNVGSVATVVTELTDQLGTATLTAGTGITITPTANTITIAATGTTSLTYTNVNTTPYVVLTTDEYLSVDTSALSITIQLPNAATSGRAYIIKDRTGAAATRNITVTTVGGAVNIDGATTFVMNTNFQSINIIGNGSTYEVY